MRTRVIRTQPVIVTLVTCTISWLVIGSAATSGAGSENSGGSCVRNVGDLNRDGVIDYAVSRSVNGASIVYLVFGEPEPSSASANPVRPRGRVVLLRGPSAVPFLCADPVATLTGRGLRTGGSRSQPRVAESPIGKPVAYTVVDLDPVMPGPIAGSSVATQINARGEIVGHFVAPNGEHAFVYDGNEVRDLGTLGGSSSFARSINDRSQIVGYSLTGELDDSGFVNEAFESDGDTMKSLGLRWSSAEHINNRGQIVGEMLVQPNLNHAFLWENGRATDLGSLPPLGASSHSVALAINDKGQIVGESNTLVTGQFTLASFNAVHAFLYENGAIRDLGTLGKVCVSFVDGERCLDRSGATDINNSGQVVGYSTGPAGGTHAFVSGPDGLRDLGTLGGDSSVAYGINDSGQIVGGSQSAAGEFSPFLYERGTMYDLSTLLVDHTGEEPFTAYAINNFGQIAGNHHLLNPIYDSVEEGRDFSFVATLGASLRFEYWVSQKDRAAPCRGLRTRPQLQVRIGATSRPGPWLPVGVLRGCDSTDWASVSLRIPDELRNTSARIHVRVQQTGPLQGALVHLRRFSTN